MLGLSLPPELAAREIVAAFLVFARLGTIVMLMPAIGEMSVPVQVRLLFGLALAVLLAPQLEPALPALPELGPALVVLLIGEIVTGLVVGMIARMVMSALSVAGTVIAMQTGLGFVQAVDPTFGVQGAIVGTFLSLVAVTFLFATGLHALLFGAIVQSYSLFPPGGALPAGDLSALALQAAAAAFAVGIQLSAPFLVFSLVFYVAAGVLNKLVPQIQVFFVLMPANILIGLTLLMLTLGALITAFAEAFAQAIGALAGVG